MLSAYYSQTQNHNAASGWIDEKARHPRSRNHDIIGSPTSVLMAELQDSDVPRPELPSCDLFSSSSSLHFGSTHSSSSSSRTGSPHHLRSASIRDRWSSRPRPLRLSTETIHPPLDTTSPKSWLVSPSPTEMHQTSLEKVTPTIETIFDPNNLKEVTRSFISSKIDTFEHALPPEIKSKNYLDLAPSSSDVTTHHVVSEIQPNVMADTIPQSALNHSISIERPASLSLDIPATLESDLTPTQAQVEELRELVCIVNREWMGGLTPDTGLHTICSTLSVRDLFDRGLRCLKQCFRGNLLSSFEDIFALMHIAFASAYIVHKEDVSYCWSTFFRDALYWQFALSSQPERQSFITVMDRWWSSSADSPMPILGYMSPAHSKSAPLPLNKVQESLISLLKKGKVIESCSYFLDGTCRLFPLR